MDNLLLHLCKIQTRSETENEFGEPVYIWQNTHTDVPCRYSTPKGDKRRLETGEYVENLPKLFLNPKMRLLCDYEDIFTESDPGDHLAVHANRLDFEAHGDEDCYLYHDFGDNFFADFTHNIDVKMLHMDIYGRGAFWMLSDAVDDMKGLRTANKTHIAAFMYKGLSEDPAIFLREFYDNKYYDMYYDLVEDTWYYLTIAKVGKTLTCKIYSDTARTTLITTLEVGLHADHKFSHLYGCCTENAGDAYVARVDIANLNIDYEVRENDRIVGMSGFEDTYEILKMNKKYNGNAAHHIECDLRKVV